MSIVLESAVIDAVRHMVDTLLLSPEFSIYAKDDDPRPIGSYADVNFVSDTSRGWEQFSDVNLGEDDITRTYEGAREIMMSVGFYRNSAMDNGRYVRLGVVRQSMQDYLRSANLGLIRRSEVRDLTQNLENGFEERSQFDLFISAIGSDADIISSINSVNIQYEYEGSQEISGEIEVS